MTEGISLNISGNVAESEELDSFESMVDEGEQAIERGDFETAFEIIHRLDENVALCSRCQLIEVVRLVEKVFDANASEGLKFIEAPFQRISFSVEQNFVFYVVAGLSGSFYVRFGAAEEGHAHALLEETYALFQKEGSAKQLEGKIKELFDMAERRQVPYIELMRLFSILAQLNVRKFETLIPSIAPNFQVTLEGDTLTLSGFGMTTTSHSDFYLLRDFSAVIQFIDGRESVEDQVEYCFLLMEVHPEKEAELLAKAKECFPNAPTSEEKYGSLIEFAYYYIKKQDEAEFHEIMKELEVVGAELAEERVLASLHIVSLKADWSLAQGDKASFEQHLSTMKQLASQIFDPEMIEYAKELIEYHEAEEKERFSSDALSMHSMKA